MDDPIISPQTSEPADSATTSPSTRGLATVDIDISTPPFRTHPALGGVQWLQASQIRLPTTVNRHASTFEGEEYREFKDLIDAAGGNSVPVLVRYLPEAIDGFHYELVSGERRTRACGASGHPVLAWVLNDCSDKEAFLKRLRENAGRADLSPYELGLQVSAGLAAKNLHSLGHAARETGRDKSDLAKAVQLAALPEPLLAAFSCRSELQYRHAKPLKDALATNTEAVLAEAARIVAGAERPPTPEIVVLLSAAGSGGVGLSHTPPAAQPIDVDGQTVGRCRFGTGGKVTIELDLPLERREREALQKHLVAFVRRRVLKTASAPKSSTQEAA